MDDHAQSTMFFVIGAPKAGTTWLHHVLSSHPQVSTGPFKEYSYFNYFHDGDSATMMPRPIASWLAGASLLRRAGKAKSIVSSLLRAMIARPNYKSLVRGSDPLVRAFGDISPEYSRLGRSAYAEMASLHQRVKFIFIMRDPVDRVWSNIRMYAHAMRGGVAPASAYHSKAFSRRMLERSNYVRVIDALNATTAPDSCLFLFYETLFEQSKIDEIADFLEIDRFEAPLTTRIYVSQEEHCPVDLAVGLRNKLAPVYERMQEMFGEDLPSAWKTNDNPIMHEQGV